MITYANESNLDELMKQDFCMLDFYSETCNPCKALAKILLKLDSELPFVNFVKVNTTQYPQYGEQFDIQAVPTLLFVRNGVVLERHLGLLNANQLKEKIGSYLYMEETDPA